MPNYTVQDNKTGKKITFEWNDPTPPTDQDMEEIFSQADIRDVQPSQPKERGFLEKTVSAIPSSGYEFGKSIVSAVTSPIQTGKAIGKTALGAAELLIPGEQGEEQYAEALGGFFKERYGGLENIKKTISEDPVGFVADVSTFLTGIGGVATKIGPVAKAGRVASIAGEFANPVSWPGKTVGLMRKGIGATKIPEELYAKTMKIPPGSLRSEERAQVIDTLLNKEKLTLGKTTRDQLNSIIKEVEDSIQPILDKLSAKGSEFNMDVVYKSLDDLKPKFAGRRDAKAAFEVIDEIKKDYMEHDFITKTMASPLEPRTNLLFKDAEPWIETKPETISRDALLNKAQEMKKKIYEMKESYYQKGAKPETGRVGIKNDIDAAGMSNVASTLRESILNHPDVPSSIKTELAREAGAMQTRKWVERAANRGGNLDPVSWGALGFGILTEGGVPAAAAYKIVMSQTMQSKLALLLRHGFEGIQKAGAIARPTAMGIYQAGRVGLMPQMEQ